MRINKYLSNLGYCSRKEANDWLVAGRLMVNGVLGFPGQWVETSDEVLLDGIPVSPRERVYLILNKPPGITCTTDSSVKDNIISFINYPQYIFPVGRLDKDSQGLMLLTNDGDLANEVLEAENGHEKAYRVTVDQPLTDEFLTGMANGVVIDGKQTRPCQVKAVETHVFDIVLSQGLNRQIRKMCWVFRYKVLKLERYRIVNIELGALPIGQWRLLESHEIERLSACLKRSQPIE